MLRIRMIDRIVDYMPLRTSWEALYARDPEAHVFLSFRWLQGVLESHPGEWFILLAISEEGGLAGVLPLRTRAVWSPGHEQVCTELQFAGRLFWADYGGMLCDPGQEAEVVAGLAAALGGMNWSHLTMKGFRISDSRLAHFLRELDDERLITKHRVSRINNGQTDNLLCPSLELPASFELWLTEQLSGNTRQKVRRFLRKTEESAEYRLTVTTPDSSFQDILVLQDLWRRQWQAEKGSETSRIAYQYGRILQRGLADDLVRLTVLWHRNRAVGALACFVDVDTRRIYFYIGGRDLTFEDLPVGLVLHSLNIRWAIEHGFREYDFLRGNEPYKYSLGATDRRLHYPCVSTRSGTNLNGCLDPISRVQALSIAEAFTKKKQDARAAIVLEQVLSSSATCTHFSMSPCSPSSPELSEAS